MALDLQWLLTQSQCIRLQLNGWDTLWTWPYTAASCNIMDHAVHQIKLRRHDSNARLMHALHPSQECQWDGWCIHHKLHSLITIVELHYLPRTLASTGINWQQLIGRDAKPFMAIQVSALDSLFAVARLTQQIRDAGTARKSSIVDSIDVYRFKCHIILYIF